MARSSSRLIVNADDYGMTPGVNRSVEELYAGHALSSASLMACSPCIEEAARFAVQNPGLGAGCHIVLIDGEPAAPPESVRSLLAPGTNRFRAGMVEFVRAVRSGKIAPSEIEIEVAAQIQRLRDYGVFVDHVDTHKHTHIFPQVLRPVLRGALTSGVRAVRNPFEQHWSVRKTRHAGFVRGIVFGGLHALYQHTFLREVAAAGMTTTAGTVGILATGSLNARVLAPLLRALPPGTWELVCHPGYVDAELGAVKTNLRESRAIEHAALLQAIPASGVTLTTFGDLTR